MYVSNLYDSKAIKSNRLNVIYAPMGSGKTTLFKQLLANHQCLMVAPYRSSRDDFGLAYNFDISRDGLNYEFLYPSDLIAAVTKGWLSASALTDEIVIEKATVDYVNSLHSVRFTHILFDEVDFMWIQAGMTQIGKSKLWTKDAKIWEYILKALARKFTLIGQTSTRIPTLGILEVGGQLQQNAHTSVRFDSITPVLVHKDVTHEKLFKTALERSIKEGEDRPTLVYKRTFSGSDILYMDQMVKQGKRVLVVLREENSPKIEGHNQLKVDVLTQVGAVEAQTSGITQQAMHLHFKIVGKNAALDKLAPSADPYLFFDYIFINTSSSRQVSLNAVRGDKNIKVNVITLGAELNSTSHQTAGRFRQNRVDIKHYLKGYQKQDIPEFSGLKLWEKLLKIDPTIESYMKHGGVSSPYCVMSGQAKAMQCHMQAEWIGKSVKGKANKIRVHRDGVFDSWFKSESNLNQTNKALLASYESYCLSQNERPFSKNIFPKKLKEVKAKQALES